MIKFYDWLKTMRIVEEQTPPKVLWFTGMGSTGTNARQLAAHGYDVKQVGTTTNHYAASIGWLNQFQPMHTLLKSTAQSIGQQHLQKNVEKHDGEMKGTNFVPDIVVGSSQGGALAMQVAHQYPHAKFVLASPAWKIFAADPSKLPKDSIIIQGTNDRQVVPSSNIDLKDRFGYEVRIYNTGHKIPFEMIKDAVDTQLKRLGIPVPESVKQNMTTAVL